MRKLPSKLASQLYGAAQLIAERGLDGTKIDDIAEATGIPKATIYYHLDGKNGVLAFLLGDLLDLIAGEVGVAVSTAEDARTRLEGAVAAQLGVMVEHPYLCRALVGDLGRATRLPDLAEALRSAFYEPIEKLLAEVAADRTGRSPTPARRPQHLRRHHRHRPHRCGRRSPGRPWRSGYGGGGGHL